jgi:hypothetical protein
VSVPRACSLSFAIPTVASFAVVRRLNPNGGRFERAFGGGVGRSLSSVTAAGDPATVRRTN